MYDSTTGQEKQDTTSTTPRLQVPLQAAPIDRTLIGSALSGNGGVDPSFDLESFLAGVGTAAAVAALL
jgi:hypothetical protein